MSIADKLNYLLETKKAIKNALIKKGVGVSDTDTFKSYADKIEGIQAGSSDVSEYFTDTISASNSSYFGWITAIKKYIPQLNVNTNGLAYFFAYYPNISIPKLNFTTDIKYMNYMFNHSKLENIDFTEFAEGINTINVKNMQYMFSDCSNLISLNLTGLDTSNVTNMYQMFGYCIKLENLDLSGLNIHNVENFGYLFSNNQKLKNIEYGENFDTSNVANMSYMYGNCPNLITIPKLNASKIINIYNFLNNSNTGSSMEFILETFGGLENLGMAYATTQSANYSNYTLDLRYCPNLTHTSLMNVINNLYDIATKGCKAQSLQLGATNIAKLTEEEIAIATSKGWTVS